MTTFLDSVAADLYTRYGDTFPDLCLVFPNRRGSLFFAQSLSKLIGKPIWQPSYSSIEEVVSKASGRKVSDPLALLLELYDIYCTVKQTDEPFDHFYFWGEVMLHDFDLIDKYRIDAAMLFRNLKEQKDLESDLSFLSKEQIEHIKKFWSSFNPEATGLQGRFIAIWDILPDIYTRFKARLNEKGMAYEGMLYRELSTLPEGKFIFIGFNALNACEKVLFRQLKKENKAEFYWDYDTYYVNNKQQEAGIFLRQNMAKFPSPLQSGGFSNFTEKKELRIISAPSDAVQSKIVPQLLIEMGATYNRNTAVVLCDEQLLIPTLHGLPSVASEINVTMGYPLKQTSIYTLIELLLHLHRTTKADEKKTRFYHKDVLSLLHHPYIVMMSANAVKYADDIIRMNKVYVPDTDFRDDSLLEAVFKPVENYTGLCEKLLKLLDTIASNIPAGGDEKMIQAYILHCSRKLNKLKKSVDESNIVLSLSVFTNLLRKLFRNETIPFTGEPLSGLQVLGLLETRGIDFEHIVLLSCNEGILPKSMNVPSFIPYNLRRGFGLPTIEQHEAVYAYYFYRVLQRAKKITLVYNTKTDEARTGEASRYLLQLKMESGHTIDESNISFTICNSDRSPIIIKKDDTVMSELMEYCKDEEPRSLSPSAINAYLSCSLKFYYRHIAHLKPRNEMEEDIGSKLLGNVLHYAMDTLYKPFEKKVMEGSNLKQMSGNELSIIEAVNLALAKAYYHKEKLPDSAVDDGKLMLLRDIAAKYIKQIIQYDSTQTPFTIEGTEMSFTERFDVPYEGSLIHPVLGGIIDRLDHKDDTLHIVDYKTGATKNDFKSVHALFGDDARQHNPAALQVLLYSVLLKKQNPNRKISPKLYFMREIYNNDVDFLITDKEVKKPITEISPYIKPFTDQLTTILSQLFDRHVSFVQTEDPNSCKYCDYKKLCSRE
jgi:hypothetical protein